MVGARNMSVITSGMTLTSENWNTPKEGAVCHLVCHKSNTHWTRIECWPPW